MRICVIIAPNDRYNYGDLLFSHVLKTKLGCYYNEFVDIATIDADLSVFGGHKVYSINNLSFASNDFLRQRHKKTTWILA